QFVFNDGKGRFGLLTDLVSYCANVLQRYQGLDALMFEANHCRDMLARGQYPVFLKQRVGCETCHLNNHLAASLVSELGW
ncbi:MBL fold metallo-hydrolase, partial [Pseudomonas syringae pv. tagetis]